MSKQSKISSSWWQRAFGKESLPGAELKKRYFVIHVLLVGFLLVAVVNTIIIFWYSNRLGDKFTGASPFIPLLVTLTTFVVYYLFRRGYVKLTSYFLFAVFWALAIYESIAAGLDNVTGVLMFAWLIVLTGILFSPQAVVGAYGVVFVSIVAIIWLQVGKIIHPDFSWKNTLFDYSNGIAYCLELLFIAIVSWLYNREITRSLDEANKSRRLLKEERDLLDVRVQQRTEELKKTQMEQIDQLSKFVEYGKNMTGLLHDLVNPVAAISMNLSHVTADNLADSKLSDVKDYTKRALSAAHKIEEFIQTNKNRFRTNQEGRPINLETELTGIVDWFSYELKKRSIKLAQDIPANLTILGDPARFDQVVSNIVSNAIEAFGDDKTITKEINIRATQEGLAVILVIADNGQGISPENLVKIFQPFFSTKKKGTGIGLAITKKIMEECFAGQITVQSTVGQGTVFQLNFPLANNHVQNITKSNDSAGD
jgi:signal transduction histidine kinase